MPRMRQLIPARRERQDGELAGPLQVRVERQRVDPPVNKRANERRVTNIDQAGGGLTSGGGIRDFPFVIFGVA
jgi:hypothetical protein